MVEPYESRRQKKPTGAVKPMPAPFLGNAPPYGQSMPTMRPMNPGMRAEVSPMRYPWQPNISMPPRPASPVQAAPTPQPRTVPWGSAAVANSGNVPGVTVPIVQTMPFQQWTQQQIASGPMNPGLPWAGSSGISRPTQAETLRDKAPETAKKVKERSIAGRAKRNEGLLPEGSRRAMVTAKAQGRRISPVQAGIESTMAGGQQLSDDQNRMLYGPALDEIKARQQAATIAAISGMLTPGEGMPQDPNVLRSVLQMLPGFMQGGGTSPPPVPWSPLDPVEAETLATESPDARTFEQRLISMGVNPDEANMETRRRFPTRIGPWQSAISEAWETAPLVGMVMTSLAESNAPQQVAQISPKALKGLQQKAKAGDPEAQRILREGGYSW